MAVETTQAQFDFGDAPDGQATGYPPLPIFAPVGRFPTYLSSDGARTLDITQMTLGPTADLEADANTVNADRVLDRRCQTSILEKKYDRYHTHIERDRKRRYSGNRETVPFSCSDNV